MKNNKIQIIRAILAIFVVLIHTLPDNDSLRIITRPILNISVAAFIFLSGYLTKLDVNMKTFYKKRLITVLLPYLIFTIIYSLPNILGYDIAQAVKTLLKNIATSGAKYHLYYLLVYAELVILTPLLTKIAKQKKRPLDVAIFLIQPLFILCLYLGITNHDILKIAPWYVVVFPAWIAFYYLGLIIGNRYKELKLNHKLLVVLTALGIALQIAEGFIWQKYSPMKDIYFSQLKITALLQNIPALLLITEFIRSKKPANWRLLEKIGNASFGIYLLHPAFILVCNKLITRNETTFLATFILAVIGPFVTVLILNKFIPKKLLKYCGLGN